MGGGNTAQQYREWLGELDKREEGYSAVSAGVASPHHSQNTSGSHPFCFRFPGEQQHSAPKDYAHRNV